jgi:hypothetical protein
MIMRKNSTRNFFIASLLLMSSSAFATDYTVTDPGDSGPGTLRQALADAQANAGADRILFNLQGAGPITIATTLNVNSPVDILGYSDPSSGEGSIPLRTIAVGVTGPANVNIFTVSSGNVLISGLAIYGGLNGVVITQDAGVGGRVKISGCAIGISEFLSAANGLNANGVYLQPSNDGFSYSNPRVIIGTDGDGVNDINEGNLLSNCGFDGVRIENCDNNVIAGNYIGTTNGGANWPFSNMVGVTLDGLLSGDGCVNNRIGTNADGVSDVLERNVISANRLNGVTISNRASGNIVAGNFIGISAGGAAAGNKGNDPYFSGYGVFIAQASNNFIGVTPTGGSAAQRNFIGSNNRDGVAIYSGGSANPSTGNIVAGNSIGLNGANANRGNLGWGIQVYNFGSGVVTGNIIGSNDDGVNDNLEGNIIAYNRKDGIGIEEKGPGTVRLNRISRNSFFENTGPAPDGNGVGTSINLLASPLFASDGVTLNDAGDGDTGPNDLLNYPVITQFGVDVNAVSIIGTAPAFSLVQFYLATGAGDAATGAPNFREGQTFLIAAQDNGPLDLDPTVGSFRFIFNQSLLTTPVTAGQEVNGISISTVSGAGNTSEFGEVSLSILPVQFLSFGAELKGDKVVVAWATALEQNASHFEVQKSTDGANFSTIGSVKAKGNSSTKVDYSYVDNNPSLGVSYYRLRQVDLDARNVYTKIVVIRNETRNKAFSVWPNPVIDNVNVTLKSDKSQVLQLRVIDYSGRVVRSNQINAIRGNNQFTVNFSTLPKGLYLINVVGEGLNLNDKVIKQ